MAPLRDEPGETAAREDHYIDALMPRKMAFKAGKIGADKASMEALPYGIVRLLSGVAFSLGLILVIIGGAELFTGNALIFMAWAARLASSAQLLRNWAIVFVGNFVGAVCTAALAIPDSKY